MGTLPTSTKTWVREYGALLDDVRALIPRKRQALRNIIARLRQLEDQVVDEAAEVEEGEDSDWPVLESVGFRVSEELEDFLEAEERLLSDIRDSKESFP